MRFFDKRGYPSSVVLAPSHHRPQQIIGSRSALQTSQKENNDRIFSQPPLISFKRDKNIGNFLVEVHFKQVINPELLNARAHDAN